MKRDRCPFCNAHASRSAYTASVFRCGTKGPDVNGEYSTGTECDKTVFRQGFARCLGLLQEVTECNWRPVRSGQYHEVQIPAELWESIRHEVGFRDADDGDTA